MVRSSNLRLGNYNVPIHIGFYQFKWLLTKKTEVRLDTLDRQRFHQITRRDELPAIMSTLDALLTAHWRIVSELGAHFSDLQPIHESPFSTSTMYHVPGHD